MTVDIFICTYWKDANWLEYCLRSIQKYATGFRQTIVLYPERDREIVKKVCDRFSFVTTRELVEGSDGHLFQNCYKSSCDLFSDANYFFHLDSDCVFTENARPEDYFTDGKVDLLFAHYSDLTTAHNGCAVPWQFITSRSLGLDTQVETMRRFPMLYRRDLYSKMRARVEATHGKSFENYVFTSESTPPAFHGYSEFNSLGSYAFYLDREPYHFYDTSNPVKKAKVHQFWSHSGLTYSEKTVLEKITEGWDR